MTQARSLSRRALTAGVCLGVTAVAGACGSGGVGNAASTAPTSQAAAAPGTASGAASGASTATNLCTDLSQSGCLQQLTTGQTPAMDGHGKLIGVLMPEEYDNSYSAAYANQLKALAKKDNVRLEILNSNYDAATQASQATELIAQHPAGIVLWPADAKAILPSLIQMKQANIPVNISNSQAVTADAPYYDSYSGPSNFNVGQDMAQQMNKLLNGHGNIIIISGQPGNSTSIDRVQSFQQHLAKGITVLGVQPGNWTKAPSEKAAASLISRFGSKINAIYAVDDTTASGVAEAEQLAGYKPGQVPIIGTGDTKLGKQLVQQGWEKVTLFQSPLWDADHVINDMLDVIAGQTLPKNIFMPLPAVTSSNVSQYPALW